ncbi:hypothetical protein V8G54_010721 [Vigna mungo]|uniref:Peptidase C1A papain C-terminal domain-containing protein n=1 Tax=Vigna mungo TaxID=3915 RepID=A0AAQ3S3D6_VIGMU
MDRTVQQTARAAPPRVALPVTLLPKSPLEILLLTPKKDDHCSVEKCPNGRIPNGQINKTKTRSRKHPQSSKYSKTKVRTYDPVCSPLSAPGPPPEVSPMEPPRYRNTLRLEDLPPFPRMNYSPLLENIGKECLTGKTGRKDQWWFNRTEDQWWFVNRGKLGTLKGRILTSSERSSGWYRLEGGEFLSLQKTKFMKKKKICMQKELRCFLLTFTPAVGQYYAATCFPLPPSNFSYSATWFPLTGIFPAKPSLHGLQEKGINCLQKLKNVKVVSIDSYEDVNSYDELALKKAVANQPVSVAIEEGGREFQLYSSVSFQSDFIHDLGRCAYCIERSRMGRSKVQSFDSK